MAKRGASEAASPAAPSKQQKAQKAVKVKEEVPPPSSAARKAKAAAKETPKAKRGAKKAAAKPDAGAIRYWQELKKCDQSVGAGAEAASGVVAPATELPAAASSEAAQELLATPSENVPPAEPPTAQTDAEELPETVPGELPLCPVPELAPAAPLKEPEPEGGPQLSFQQIELDYAGVPIEDDEYLGSWFGRPDVLDLGGEILRVKSHPWFAEHYDKIVQDVGESFDWGSADGDQLEDLKAWVRWYQCKCANQPMPQSAAEAACPPSGNGPRSVADSEFWMTGLAEALDGETGNKSMEPGRPASRDSDSDAHSPDFAYEADPDQALFRLRCMAKEQIERIIAKSSKESLLLTLNSLPKKLYVMSACSGSGMLELVVDALVSVMNGMILDQESSEINVAPLFMCEITPFKQKFLREIVMPLANQEIEACLFQDVTGLNHPQTRSCLVHKTACALPDGKWDDDELAILGAGFSCKSFSRMNNDYNALKTALADDKDCSSVATFKGVGYVVEKTRPHVVTLENVDSIDASTGEESEEKETNLSLVLKHLEELGYAAAAHKLRASDYGLPQRRTRYYIVGVRRDSELFSGSMEDVFSSVAERLQWLKCESSPPVELLLKSEDPLVLKELGRRAALPKDGASHSNHWASQHTALAEKYGAQWPLQPSAELAASQWFQVLPPREKEVLCFVELWNSQRSEGNQIEFIDISQSVSRVMLSTADSKVVPTVMPSGKVWWVPEKRLLLGREMMSLQGLSMADDLKIDSMESGVVPSEAQMSDLAGNAFASSCIMGTLLSVLSSLRCDTASELEELQQIRDVFRKPKGTKLES